MILLSKEVTIGNGDDVREVAIGRASFKKFIEVDLFYIDKTMFIKDFINAHTDVVLITRPRRFGKSLNLDMLEEFIDITKDSKEIFVNLNIGKYHEISDKHMNKYPVIRLDLKGITGNDFDSFKRRFYDVIRVLYSEFDGVIDEKLVEDDLDKYHGIRKRQKPEEFIDDSLRFLTQVLHKKYRKKVIVLIDEYDNPLEKAYANGYYNEAVNMASSFLSNALKGNEYLEKALLIGCSKVTQAGIFSDLNNLSIHSIENDNIFNAYFGFTEDEVRLALKEYDLEDTLDEVKKWYDGYDFYGIKMYNPWSITHYLNKREV